MSGVYQKGYRAQNFGYWTSDTEHWTAPVLRLEFILIVIVCFLLVIAPQGEIWFGNIPELKSKSVK